MMRPDVDFRSGAIHPIECVKEGWAVIKDEYWMMLAISLVGGVIGAFTLYILIGPMVCGIYLAYLRKVDRGGRASFDDLWAGMKLWRRSIGVTLAIVLPILAWMAITFIAVYLPMLTAATSGRYTDPDEIMRQFYFGMAIDLVVAVVMVCIHSVLMFAFPLIADKGLGSWDAIKLSARASIKNFGGIGGIIGISMLIALAGYLLLCIGLYLIIPIITAANVAAYRKVFPGTSSPLADMGPPPPTAYQGL